MRLKKTFYRPWREEIRSFIVHLRWHYQLGILSGGFLLGGVLSVSIVWQDYLLQFLNVHLLLFGGATAYNSFWDNDKGPIGGLKKPPQMSRWMHPASLILLFVGLILAFNSGVLFVFFYLISITLFWLYSTPAFRWKGSPIKSLFAIGISTGAIPVLLGYLATGNKVLYGDIVLPTVGVMLIVLSLYPVSQVYQISEDIERGDQTFAVKYGFSTVLIFFLFAFEVGILLVSLSIIQIYLVSGSIFLLLGTAVWVLVYLRLKRFGTGLSYHQIMQIKYSTSFCFLAFLIFMIVLKHIK